MALLETKYSVGDTVWYAHTVSTVKQHPCPDCLDSRKWEAKSPAGGEFKFACPRCSAGYSGENDLSLKYTCFVAAVQRLTVGSVRVDTASTHWPERHRANTYMCNETGVGSGNVYDEESLFLTGDEAMQCAEAKASVQNTTNPWVVKQFSKSLRISDYELSEARESTLQIQLRAVISDLKWLITYLEGAQSRDEILELVKRWEEKKADAERLAQ